MLPLKDIELKIKLFTRKNWKRILVIFSIYGIWTITFMLYVIYLQGGFDILLKEYGSTSRFYNEIIHTIIKGTVVYYILIFQLIIPVIKNRKWKKALLKMFLFFLLLTFYEYLWQFQIGTRLPSLKNSSVLNFLMLALGLDVLLIIISVLISVIIESNEMFRREAALEKQKLSAELAAIKYQINPHFLFNSLSFIYTKSIKNNPEAAHAVHLLSEIMSYALSEWDDLGRVPLALEIDHMKKVIEMNQIRFNNKLNISYKEVITPNEAYIPTLAFITLVENAFKHGELNDSENLVTVRLKVTGEEIYFAVSNKKKKGPKEPSHGIGISNVQQRLQLMYGANHSFVIQEDDNYYSNEITINLSNHDQLYYSRR